MKLFFGIKKSQIHIRFKKSLSMVVQDYYSAKESNAQNISSYRFLLEYTSL